MSTNITKSGLLNITLQEHKCIINNFTQSGTETDWSFGTHTLSNGVVQLTGVNPSIYSTTFSVGANDILVFEFTVSLPTPSTTTGGPGLYLGTKYGDSTKRYYYNNGWQTSSTGDTNPYFLYSYNSTAVNQIRTFILGSNANINDVPIPTISSAGTTVYALQVPNATTYIRSGYNSNTAMVINFYNPRIYNINYMGACENTGDKQVANGFVSFNSIIEY